MALLLLLMLALAWQGISAAWEQRRMVREILQDYARLIADNYATALQSEIGFRGFYQLTQRLQEEGMLQPDGGGWQDQRLETIISELFGPGAISGAFRSEPVNGSVSWLWGESVTNRQLSEQFAPLTSQPVTPPFEVLHAKHADRTQTALIIPGTNQQTILLVNPDALPMLFEQVFTSQPLLPAALGDPARLRPNIHLDICDPDGKTLFESATPLIPVLAASATIGGDYAGLFKDFTITASIRPSIAGELVLGGLPYGRLPFIVLLLVVASMLAVVSFILLRKQRQLLELRNDFVARVSHELRTPLTQIRMFTESLLLNRLPDVGDREQALTVINRESRRLSRLVDNILQFEQGGAIQLPDESQPYALLGLCRQLAEDFQPMMDARSSQLNISCSESSYCRKNREGLIQILTNLMDNALKYGPDGQTISLTVLAEDKKLQFILCDQGPGIPDPERERIFEPYYRLEREKQKAIAGTGIGLSVSRELAAAIGAELAVEPGAGEGSCFTMKFNATEAGGGTSVSG